MPKKSVSALHIDDYGASRAADSYVNELLNLENEISLSVILKHENIEYFYTELADRLRNHAGDIYAHINLLEGTPTLRGDNLHFRNIWYWFLRSFRPTTKCAPDFVDETVLKECINQIRILQKGIYPKVLTGFDSHMNLHLFRSFQPFTVEISKTFPDLKIRIIEEDPKLAFLSDCFKLKAYNNLLKVVLLNYWSRMFVTSMGTNRENFVVFKGVMASGIQSIARLNPALAKIQEGQKIYLHPNYDPNFQLSQGKKFKTF